jgi:hypothetical protein
MALRNALAHGGVSYLDKNGRQTECKAAMFAFVSGKLCRNKIVSFDLLRISEADLCAFLLEWSRWLKEAGIAQEMGEVAGIERAAA